MQKSLPVSGRPRRPEWMKVRAPSADSLYGDVRELLRGQHLHTVCEEAHCPNVGECWGQGTAAFQILGDTCSRACRYCNVHSGKPEGPPDPDEPRRLAETVARMKLRHVVALRDLVRAPLGESGSRASPNEDRVRDLNPPTS